MGLMDFIKPKRLVTPVELNPQNFAVSLNNSPVPVLVDFYSTTCVPCRQMAKTVTKFATDFQGRVRVGAFNVGQPQAEKISNRFSVRAVPTLILFKNGKPVETFVGLTGYLKLQEALEQLEK